MTPDCRLGSGGRLVIMIAGIVLLGGAWGFIPSEDHARTATFPPDFLDYAWAQVTGVMSPFDAGNVGHRGGGGVSLKEARDVAIFESGGATYAAVSSYKAGARPNTDAFGDNSRIGGGVQILKLTDSNGAILNSPSTVGHIRDAQGRDLNGATGIITFESGGTTYAAVASYRDDGLQIIDLSDPENPDAVGHLRDPGGQSFNEAWDVAVFGTANTYAALTGKGSNNVQIIDFSDLSSLSSVGGIGRSNALTHNPRGIATFEAGGRTYAAVASSSYSNSGVQILDLSDPTSPSDAGRITNTGSLELRGAWDIAIFEATSGVSTLTYAAVASNNDRGVQILQLTGSNGMILANPAPAGRITDGGSTALKGAQSIATFEYGGITYASVASRDEDGVQILQLTGSNGAILDNPAPAGRITDGGSRKLNGARGIATFEATSGGNTFAYAAVASDDDSGVQILRLNTPPSVNAAALGTIELAGKITDDDSRELRGANGIATFKSDGVNYAAVAADRDNGVQIVSLADLAGPYAAGKLADTTGANGLLLDGARGIATFESTSGNATTTYAAVASYDDDGVQIISLADPASPTPAGKLANTGSRELNGANGIATFTSGGTAYAAVAAYDDAGVQIINLSDPLIPAPAGKIADTDSLALNGAHGIATFESGGTTYAAVTSQIDSGVQILRLTGSNGTILANPSPAGKITDNDSRVLTVPQHIAIFESGGTTYAAVTSSVEDGVQILKLTDSNGAILNRPAAVASVTDSTDTNLTDYDELDGATGITTFVLGTTTYAAVASDGDKGVQIIDLSDPASPKAAGQITDDGSTLLQSATGIATFELAGTTRVAVTSNNEHGVQILIPHPPPFHEGDTVILSGAAFDPEGHALTYAWTRNSGPQVSLADSSALSTTFTAPQVTSDRTVTFTLAVSDTDSTSESVSVRILDTGSPPSNDPPAVEAGPDQTVDEGDTVTLSGSASDPEGNTLVYRWTHDSDLPIGLADSRIPTTTFTAPEVASDATVTFTLEASDGTKSASDDVTVTITHVNKPPTAEAGPFQTVDAGETVTLSGTASDPDSTHLTYSWTHDTDLPIFSAGPENPEAAGSIEDTEGSGELFLDGPPASPPSSQAAPPMRSSPHR